MWGADYLDRSETSFWDQSYKGEIIWDSKFSENFHKVENQQAAFDLCSEISDVQGVIKQIELSDDGSSKDTTVNCWALSFAEYVGDGNFPVPDKDDFYEKLIEWLQTPYVMKMNGGKGLLGN